MSAILVALVCLALPAARPRLGGGAEAPSIDAATRPNVLVVVTDDQAVGTMGFEGHPWSQTPSIDALAREGVVFTDAFVTTPLCSPSRASFLTGRYARSHGIVNNRTPLPAEVPTFASLMTEAGYDSAYVGKWHMGRDAGARAGFAWSASFPGQGTYRRNTYVVGTAEASEEITRRGWVDDVTTDFALEFLRRPREAPFLLVVGFKGPHRPHLPPPRHANDYADRTTLPPLNAEAYPPYPLHHEVQSGALEGNESGRARHKASWRGGFKGTYQTRLRNYFQVLAGLDDNVGRMRATLEELGVLEDTVVVFTSDNGFCLGHHGMVGKAVLYDEALRVPFVVRYPRRFAPLTTSAEALNVDLAPTLLELAGVPADALEAQGRSLVPILAGAPPPASRPFAVEYYRGRGTDAYGPTSFALRTPEWKLILYPGHDGWTELFDLVSDPFEIHNLAGTPEAAETLARLRRELVELEAEMGPRRTQRAN